MASGAPATATASGNSSPPQAREVQRQNRYRGQQNRQHGKAQPRPDHFLALQVSHHHAITQAIGTVQASLVAHSPHLLPALVEPITAHITLGVLCLRDAAMREAAAAALQPAATAAGQQLGGGGTVTLMLEGLSHFRNQVLYLDVRQDTEAERLHQLAAAVRAHYIEAGLLLQADRPLGPHVTVAKMSKMAPWQARGRGKWRGKGSSGKKGTRGVDTDAEAVVDETQADCEGRSTEHTSPSHDASVGGVVLPREDAGDAAAPDSDDTMSEKEQQRSIRGIPPDSYEMHAGICAGPVTLIELQLCAMEGRKPGEYYPVIASARLDEVEKVAKKKQ